MINNLKIALFSFLGLSLVYADESLQETLQTYNNFSEIRLGVLAHDLKFPLKQSHERGVSLNGEYMFTSPQNGFFQAIFSPHPHCGVSINSRSGTSMAYIGLTWEIPFPAHWFGDIILGGAIHNGHTKKDTKHRKNYGCRLLFHSGLALGYIFQEHHTLSLMVDHISNARIYTPNPGFTDLGLRYGYRF